MDDGEPKTSGDCWANDGEEWLSLAQRAEMRRRLETLAARDARRDWVDGLPPAGEHYSNKTGHKGRGLAAKGGQTSRARFELTGVPDSLNLEDGTGPFNPLAADTYNNRGFNEPASASPDAAPMDGDTDVPSESPMAEETSRKPRVIRDRPTTKPSITRGNCGGNRR